MMYEEFSWRNAKHDSMIIEIMHHGHVVMHFFLGEGMEGAGRKRVMAHVRECDSSTWLTAWREHAQDEMLQKLGD
jgi:biotin synthase-related radical SAM superfamily protein